MKILLVEDVIDLAAAVAEAMRGEHYAVDIAYDGEQASELRAVSDYDLVILDRTIPPPSGMELLAGWRAAGDAIPVLILTGDQDLERLVEGLDAGADDYLTKPFEMRELLARVRSLLRRRIRPLQPALAAGDVEMDRSAKIVRVGGRRVKLSPKEFALLEFLLRRKGEVVSRSDIEEHVWDSSFDSFTNVIDVLIYRLRKKIDGGRDGDLIQTVKGSGYRIRPSRR